jgi:hypothetical protein
VLMSVSEERTPYAMHICLIKFSKKQTLKD